MENLFDFCCRIEQRLLSMGFEFHYQSPDSGSRYYHKPVRYYTFPWGEIKEVTKGCIIVRLSDHHIPDNPDGSSRGNYDYQFIHGEWEEDIEETFEDLKDYSW